MIDPETRSSEKTLPYFIATCPEHPDFVGRLEQHSTDAWLELTSHRRALHGDDVVMRLYRRTTTYVEVIDEPFPEREEDKDRDQ